MYFDTCPGKQSLQDFKIPGPCGKISRTLDPRISSDIMYTLKNCVASSLDRVKLYDLAEEMRPLVVDSLISIKVCSKDVTFTLIDAKE